MNDRVQFEAMIEGTRQLFEAKSAARDAAIAQSRTVIGHCANAIRAVHRREWDVARERLETARQAADEMRRAVADYPDLYHSGYTQDALKEVAEAFATYALVRGEALPLPDALDIEPATYLNGLAEAASERRQIPISSARYSDEAVRLLEDMDQIYDTLISTFTTRLPAGCGGVSISCAVCWSGRAATTTSLRQQRLQDALAQFEQRMGVRPATCPRSRRRSRTTGRVVRAVPGVRGRAGTRQGSRASGRY